jgi:phage-related protein
LPAKIVKWVASSQKDLLSFPRDVQAEVGAAIAVAQRGAKSLKAKPLKGIGAGVLEIVDDYDGDTYRAVYTVRFADAIYVLHCFQKKSTSGIKTPKPDVNLIKTRLKWVEAEAKLQAKASKKKRRGT